MVRSRLVYITWMELRTREGSQLRQKPLSTRKAKAKGRGNPLKPAPGVEVVTHMIMRGKIVLLWKQYAKIARRRVISPKHANILNQVVTTQNQTSLVAVPGQK
jgi:hypothetical protein